MFLKSQSKFIKIKENEGEIMFTEKLADLKHGMTLNDFASTLVCGVDENGNKIMCDYYKIVNLDGKIIVVFGSDATAPHSEYLCTDFAVKDNNNLACEKTIEKVTEQWTDFLFMTFGENYSTAYLNNKISDNNQFTI